jgi:hypothetical protein
MSAHRCWLVAVPLIALAVLHPNSLASAVANTPTASVSAGAADGTFGVDLNGVIEGNDKMALPVVVTRVNDCGTPPVFGHIVTDPTELCAQADNFCSGRPQTSPTGQPLTILSTQIQNPKGAWSQGPVNCGANAGAPGLDQAAIHDAFVKLVPNPTIGTAPPTTKTGLVNVEVLTWLTTPATVNLGTTPLLGHQVTLTATVQSVTWTWGDHTTDTIHKPGRPFLSTDFCDTTTCPDWFATPTPPPAS